MKILRNDATTGAGYTTSHPRGSEAEAVRRLTDPGKGGVLMATKLQQVTEEATAAAFEAKYRQDMASELSAEVTR